MAVAARQISEIFRWAGLKIRARRRGLAGALDGPARGGARMGRAGRTARWLPSALAERLLDFDRLNAACPRGRAAVERVAVRKAAKPG